jgi:hypothetical protein
MVSALLLGAALAAAPSTPAIRRDGRVDAPEGFRAQLPAGLRYVVAQENGYTYYRGVDPGGRGVVSLALVTAGEAGQCPSPGELEARPGVRVQVAALRTRAGLEGCLVRSRNEQGAVVLAFVFGDEPDVVVIAAIATGAERAERQARAVAESVAFLPRAAADPRLVGCFTRESSNAIRGTGDTPYFAGVRWTTRCFLAGGRFVQKRGAAAGIASRESLDAEGAWTVRAGRLEVQTGEDRWGAPVQLDGDDLVLDGEAWRRESDIDPDL